jgi:hypothetical protein
MKKRIGRRDAAKERRWRALVAKHVASGLSVRAFCAAEGVAENSFYGWRRKLALRDVEAKAQSGKAKRRTQAAQSRRLDESRKSPSRFVPVTLSQIPTAPAVEIALPSGLTLRVAAGCDEATLRIVLGALEVS